MADEKRVVETAGKNVESAISAGLAQLGVDRDDVEIEVLDEGRQGMFGIGARAARVRLTTTVSPAPEPEPPVTPEPSAAPEPPAAPAEPEVSAEPEKPEPPSEPPEPEPVEAAVPEPEPVEAAVPEPEPELEPEEKEAAAPEPEPEEKEEEAAAPEPEPEEDVEEPDISEVMEAEVVRGVVQDLLAIMGMNKAQVEVERAEPGPNDTKVPPWEVDVRGPGTDALVGHNGETLDALQRIVRLIVGREMRSWVHLVVDVQGYKAQRAEELRNLAYRMANQAVDTDRTVVLEPMPPHERRVVHVALYDDQRVTTESIGEGDRRRVTITPERQ